MSHYKCIEIELPGAAIDECSKGGRDATEFVKYWLSIPGIADQLKDLTLQDTQALLWGYGAWDLSALQDLNTNLERILWIAAGNCRENNETTATLEGSI